jgi:hypothetical protein
MAIDGVLRQKTALNSMSSEVAFEIPYRIGCARQFTVVSMAL